jgi:hypothetical protein
MKLGPNIEARVEFCTEGWCVIEAWDLVGDKPIPEEWLDSLAVAYEQELAEEHHQGLIGRAEDLMDRIQGR